jgi:hypothetical protein
MDCAATLPGSSAPFAVSSMGRRKAAIHLPARKQELRIILSRFDENGKIQSRRD